LEDLYRMKKEGRMLKDKGVASLILSIDHFNRLWDTGRLEAVLILLDHSFEMLLKGAILFRDGKIREPRERNTIGFDACVRRALSTEGVKFLIVDQALVLQTINGLRDAAQHHLLHLSEGQLYIHAQSGVTLFRDILKDVFSENLSDYLPDRALPISTVAPLEPIMLFANELDEVRKLLAPGRRRRTEAEARLRGLAIVDSALQGERSQPGTSDLRKLSNAVVAGKQFHDVFPGIAAVDFMTEGNAPKVSLRIAKKEGMPVHLVQEGTPDASVVAVKRVDELSYYSLGHAKLAQKVGLTPNKTTAAVRVLNLKSDADSYKEISIGKSKFNRYSIRAIERINELLKEKSADEIWALYRAESARAGTSARRK
jgi:hypothetical protein